MKDLTKTEEFILNCLENSQKMVVPIKRSSGVVEVIGDRKFRKAIHNLRNAGYHIISESSKSGFWLGTDDEWNAFCDRERKAALNRLHRKTWENGRQLRIEVEEMTEGGTTDAN